MVPSPVSNYDQQQVVDRFARFVELSQCEKYLFDKYLPAGKRILDLGMGAGRTTAYLAPAATEYVGIDYAPNMVNRCRQRFPQLRLEVGDAADLSRFPPHSFDGVVFSFNGIDCLPTDEARMGCLHECHRVLAADGVLILSIHNPRHILTRPQLANVPLWKKLWRLLYAVGHSIQLTCRIAPSRAFRAGEGYIWDPADGGFRVYMAAPVHVERQFHAAGLASVEIVPHNYPARTSVLTTPWYYYVARKCP